MVVEQSVPTTKIVGTKEFAPQTVIVNDPNPGDCSAYHTLSPSLTTELHWYDVDISPPTVVEVIDANQLESRAMFESGLVQLLASL